MSEVVSAMSLQIRYFKRVTIWTWTDSTVQKMECGGGRVGVGGGAGGREEGGGEKER